MKSVEPENSHMLAKTNSRAKLFLLQRKKSVEVMDDYTKRLVLCFSEKLDQAKVGYIEWNSFKLMAMVSYFQTYTCLYKSNVMITSRGPHSINVAVMKRMSTKSICSNRKFGGTRWCVMLELMLTEG